MSEGRFTSSGKSWTTEKFSRENRVDFAPVIAPLQLNGAKFSLRGIVQIAGFLDSGFQLQSKEVHFPFTDKEFKHWLLSLILKRTVLQYRLYSPAKVSTHQEQIPPFEPLIEYRANSACLEFVSPGEQVTVWKQHDGLEVVR